MTTQTDSSRLPSSDRQQVQSSLVEPRYARLAAIYDLWGRLTESDALRLALQRAAICDGERVLEVGAGTGLLFRQAVACNPSGVSTAVDLSRSMLAVAAQRVAPARKGRVTLACADARRLPCPERTFDVVLNSFMFDLLPEEEFATVLNEFKRVLVDGGRIVIGTMAFGSKRVHKVWAWLARTFPVLLTGCRPIALAPHLRRAGFIDITVEQVSQNTFPAEVLSGRLAPAT